MSDQVREGDILAGKFRIERVLGKGAMGVVVAATHIQLDERVALKFLLPEALENSDAVARFAREARAAVKIKSEHVARVSDVGTLDNGSPYMVMEYLQGRDLAEWMRERGPLEIPEAIEFLLQACEALAEAHALGIVHRDLKPANLFVTMRADGTPCIKVLDFGISKFTASGASELDMTKTSTVMGSPLYMSPEQLSSTRGVDARADIWAIGVILFELVSGRVPFEAESMPALCRKVVEDPPPSLRELRGDVPEELEPIVLRCLAKDRAQRFANVAELASALAPFGPPGALRSAERIARVLRAASPLSRAEEKSVPPLAGSATGNAITLRAEPSSIPPRRKRGRPWLLIPGLLAAATALFAVSRVVRPLEHSAEPQTLPPNTRPAENPLASSRRALPTVAPVAAPSTTPAAVRSGEPVDDRHAKPRVAGLRGPSAAVGSPRIAGSAAGPATAGPTTSDPTKADPTTARPADDPLEDRH